MQAATVLKEKLRLFIVNRRKQGGSVTLDRLEHLRPATGDVPTPRGPQLLIVAVSMGLGGTLLFTPPQGWHANPKSLEPSLHCLERVLESGLLTSWDVLEGRGTREDRCLHLTSGEGEAEGGRSLC